MREELKNLKTSDPKEYWKILNRGREKKQPDIPMEDLFNFFFNLNTAPDLPTRKEEHLNHEPLDNVNFEQLNEGINTYISLTGKILSCIKKLKNNKASGEDHIINEYIKSTSGLFLPIYENIFNLIFETGFLPDIWLINRYIRIKATL
jgi:hypothetical protein